MDVFATKFDGYTVYVCAKHRKSALFFSFDSETEECVLLDDKGMNYEEDGYRILLELECRGYEIPNRHSHDYPNFDYLSVEDSEKVITNIHTNACRRPEGNFPNKKITKKHISGESGKLLDNIRDRLFKNYDIKREYDVLNSFSVTFNNFPNNCIDSIRYVYYLMGWSNVEFINNKIIFTK